MKRVRACRSRPDLTTSLTTMIVLLAAVVAAVAAVTAVAAVAPLTAVAAVTAVTATRGDARFQLLDLQLQFHEFPPSEEMNG